jgi:hypothetical protein
MAVSIHPLTTAGMPSRHTWLIRIVVTASTGVRQALVFVTQRVGIAHQAGNFSGDVSRQGHGKPRMVMKEIILAVPFFGIRYKKIFLTEGAS